MRKCRPGKSPPGEPSELWTDKPFQNQQQEGSKEQVRPEGEERRCAAACTGSVPNVDPRRFPQVGFSRIGKIKRDPLALTAVAQLINALNQRRIHDSS